MDPREPAASEEDGLFLRLQEWFRRDKEHTNSWRDDAREDFDFIAGRQWSQVDEAKLTEQNRPVITFNRAAVIIDSVCGDEVKNRQEIRFIPREPGDAKANELYTSAGDYFRDQCYASDEESAAFRDMLVCGMGWTEERIDHDGNPDGDYTKERIDPLEMYWDCSANKANCEDARRVFRVRRMAKSSAEAMFPGYDCDALNAAWAEDEAPGETPGTRAPGKEYTGKEQTATDEKEFVTIVHCQWYEHEHFVRYVDPVTNSAKEMPVPDFDNMAKALVDRGMIIPPKVVQTRKVYRQAFLGSKILGEVLPTPCPSHFSYQCVTGYQDVTKRTWYGLVRKMKDPQRWANKWLSQTLHILNSSASGGPIAEEGVFTNVRDVEKDWTNPAKIVQVTPGALQNKRLQLTRNTAALPAGHMQLLEYAVSTIRDATGINLEMLGQRAVDQPASLEYQRRQAAMTILMPLFSNLRRYRKRSGEILLYFLQHNLSDGRIVRIVGEAQAQYVPLMRQAALNFDVIVDEVATSPNQKEATYGIIQALLPALGNMLTPGIVMELLEYTPLPESVVEKIRAVAEREMQAASQQPSPEMQKVQAQMQLEQAKMQQQAGLKQQEMQQQAQIEQIKMAQSAEVEKIQAEADIITRQRETEAQIALKEKEFEFNTRMEMLKFEFERELKLLDLQIKQQIGAQKAELSGLQGRPVGVGSAEASTLENAMAMLAETVARSSEMIVQSQSDMKQTQAEIQRLMAAPKRIVRGPDGRAVGTETVI